MSQMSLDEAMATVKGYLVDGKKRCTIMDAWKIICSNIEVSQKPSHNTGNTAEPQICANIPCAYCIHGCNPTLGICGPEFPKFTGRKLRVA